MWDSEEPTTAFVSAVSPAGSARAVSDSRTPAGAGSSVVESALQITVASPSTLRIVFGVPSAQPGCGTGIPVPARPITPELAFWLGACPAHDLELSLDCPMLATEPPARLALATEPDPDAVWQLPFWPMDDFDCAAPTVIPFAPPMAALATEKFVPAPFDDAAVSAVNSDRQTSLALALQTFASTCCSGASGPELDCPGGESTPRNSCPNSARIVICA